MSNTEKCFSRGPAIEVHIKIAKGLIQDVALYPSSSKLKWCLNFSQPDFNLESQIESWLMSYVKGEQPGFTLPLNWEEVSPFTEQVLHVIETIPFGSTLSYKSIARIIHNQKASRAVGGACGRNPFPLLIPCHRVLSSGNKVGGFSEGIEIKKCLLAFEGIQWRHS